MVYNLSLFFFVCQVKELQESYRQEMDSLKTFIYETTKTQAEVLRHSLLPEECDEGEEDPKLANWLEGLGLSDSARRKVSCFPILRVGTSE